MLFAGRVCWECPEHSSNSPCAVGSGAPCKAWCWVGTQRQLHPHPAHDAMAELGAESTAGMTSPGPSPPSLWGHPGLNEGGVMGAAFPVPGAVTPAWQRGGHCGLCVVLLLISVTATVPGVPAWGWEQDQECSMGRCQGHSCCWHCSGLPGGRSNTAPGQLLLPPGCSVVVAPIIGIIIIKMIFFSSGCFLASLRFRLCSACASLLLSAWGEGHGGRGVSYKPELEELSLA